VRLDVRVVVPADHDAWSALFDEYRAAAGLDPDPVVTARSWSWVADPTHPVRALVAVDGDTLVGFAHARRFPRPILADEGLYLDDLFTRPSARGRGVARALLHRLAQEARADGLGVLRWTTRPGNAAARRLYDDLASVADSVTYDLRP
jgi:GNAT superfamily N-acetyltransferase